MAPLSASQRPCHGPTRPIGASRLRVPEEVPEQKARYATPRWPRAATWGETSYQVTRLVPLFAHFAS